MDLIGDWKNKRLQQKNIHKKLIKRMRPHKGKQLNRLGDEVHEAVFEKVDCLDCANCCTSIPPIVNKTDAVRIAKRLGLKVADFEAKYLIQDEDGDRVMNASPCPFLKADNYCGIYEFRPKACRQYPHTDAFEFSNNLHLHAINAQYCPGAFHILERMKAMIP